MRLQLKLSVLPFVALRRRGSTSSSTVCFLQGQTSLGVAPRVHASSWGGGSSGENEPFQVSSEAPAPPRRGQDRRRDHRGSSRERRGGPQRTPSSSRAGGGPTKTRQPLVIERQPRDWDRFAEDACEFVFGIAPVLAALRSRRRDYFYALYVEVGFQDRLAPTRKAAKSKESTRAARILDEATDVEVVEVPKGQLCEAPGLRDATTQGVALCCSPLTPRPLSKLPVDAAPGTVYLALDEIQDPRNLGALLRSARFLGAHGVLVSAKNSAPLSPVASKASSGALEEMSQSIFGVKNLPKVLNEAKHNGNWRIVAAAVSKHTSVPLATFQPVGPRAPPTVVVLGSEGTGLRKLVLDAADHRVMVSPGIPAFDDISDVDSLNVAVTGALMLYHFLPWTKVSPASDEEPRE